MKNLTTAEGGAVTWLNRDGLDNEKLYKEFQLFSLHGQNKDAHAKFGPGGWEYDIIYTGYKCNMTDMTAAFGLKQLERFPALLKRRSEIYQIYDDKLLPLGIERLAHEGANFQGNYHLYLTRMPGMTVEQRNEIMARMDNEFGIGQNVNISNNVRIGNGCKLQNNVSIYEGVELEDYVFCGPSCVFTNDLTPRAKYPKGHVEYKKTLVKSGASIGANATIVCGHTVGSWAMIGAGAVVTSDVPNHALMLGVPARQVDWVCECGERLHGKMICKKCGREYRKSEKGLEENRDAVPASIRTISALAQTLEACAEQSMKRARYTPGIAVPQWYGGRLQYLLPLFILNNQHADVALTLDERDGFYMANTALTLEMAYGNARLIARPEAQWLTEIVDKAPMTGQ